MTDYTVMAYREGYQRERIDLGTFKADSPQQAIYEAVKSRVPEICSRLDCGTGEIHYEVQESFL